jgi:hypothetical protein
VAPLLRRAEAFDGRKGDLIQMELVLQHAHVSGLLTDQIATVQSALVQTTQNQLDILAEEEGFGGGILSILLFSASYSHIFSPIRATVSAKWHL